MDIKEWVRAARKKADLTQEQLGDRVGRTKANVGHWEKGLHQPGWDMIQAIASATGFPLPSDELGEMVQTKPVAGLPLVGEVKGGEDGYLEELQYPVGHGEGVIEYPTSDPHAYALRVRGDSMFPRYRAGEFVIVEPSIEPQTGDDVVVLCTNGRKLLKVMNWKRDGEIQLLSINNGYAPLTLPLAEVQSVQLASGRARRNALKKI